MLDNPLAELFAFACIVLKFELTPLFAACAALVALACAFFILLDTPADKLSAWLTASTFMLDAAALTPLAMFCAFAVALALACAVLVSIPFAMAMESLRA